MFGAVNSVFSGLAFAGIIITIYLQRKELGYQRDELRETRKEFQQQNETLKLQRFENTFFSLLELHHKIVDSLDIIDKGDEFSYVADNEYRRRDIFKYLYDNYFIHFKGVLDKKELNESYKVIYQKNNTELGHYFRNLYRIIKLIDSQDFKLQKNESLEKMKYKYTCIVRAQLSDYELLTLFYNCISEYGEEKFKPFIEKYVLFKNIPKGDVKEQLDKFYKSEAYNKPKKYN